MNDIVKKTRMPLVAGILDIAIGLLILCMLFVFAIAPVFFPTITDSFVTTTPSIDLVFLLLPGFIICVVAIAGGIFAIRRKRWGWALLGSIAAAIVPIPLGVAAIILLILSRKEFPSV